MNQRDRLLFITGCTGLALMVVISLFIKCPTVSQEWTLSIALGLAAALWFNAGAEWAYMGLMKSVE